MTSNSGKCPVCRRGDATVSSHFPLFQVRCPTCGDFSIDRALVDDRELDRPWIWSGILRRSSDKKKPLKISFSNRDEILASVPVPANPLEQLDLALLYIADRRDRADEHIAVDWHSDYPYAFARDGEEFRFLLDTLVKPNLLEERSTDNRYRVTPQGWQRAEELRKTRIDSNKAFVATWFDDSLDNAAKKGILPALESMGFQPVWLKAVEHNEKIDDLIIAEIRQSGLVIADVTGVRPNVYFEAGFAMGLGIPIIWTCHESDRDKLQFDTRQFNHIVWSNPEDLREQLQRRIAATIPGRSLSS